MGWEIVAILWALSWAIGVAGKALWRNTGIRREEKKVRKAARSQLVSQYLGQDIAPREAKARARLDAAATVTVKSWAVIWAALKDGWSAGWNRGKEDVHARRDRQKPRSPAVRGTGEFCKRLLGNGKPCGQEVPEGNNLYCTKHALDDAARRRPPNAAECTWVIPEPEDHGSPLYCLRRIINPEKEFCPVHDFPEHGTPAPKQAAPTTDTTPKGTTSTMATGSHTHGEVRTFAQLLTFLDGMKAKAAADVEDSQSNEKLAADTVKEIEVAVASLSVLKVDEASVSAVQALAEAFVEEGRQAKNRAAAAERRLGMATAARTTTQRNHAGIRDAVVAAPVKAADGAFYEE